MKNFIYIESDFDCELLERNIFGQFTKKRRKVLESYVRRYNYLNKYPHGEGYRCGCQHDCCGCIVSNRMTLKLSSNFAKITIKKTYNY